MPDRGQASGLVIAVILMQADRNGWIDIRQRIDHPRQHQILGIGACTARRLQNNRRIAGCRSFHHGKPLLHIVDVEGGNAVTILGSMIEQLSQGNPGHDQYSFQFS